MPNYRKVKSKIEPRAVELLSRLPITTEDGKVVPYDQNAPGLYPDETVLELKPGGEQIAISVEHEILDNNGGVAFTGWARWLNDDGSTREDANGRPVETSHSASFTHGYLELHPLEELAGEVAKMLVGEDPTMVDVDVDPDVVSGAKPMFGEGQDTESMKRSDPERDRRKMIDVPDQDAHSANIRTAITNVKRLEKLAVPL